MLALTSAVTGLRGHELALSLACVVLITFANLRGVKEAGLLFALPTYAFVDVDLRSSSESGVTALRDSRLPAGGRAAPDRRGHRRA